MFDRNMLTYANRFKLSRWNDITNAISDKCPWILSWTLLPRSWWVNCLHSRPDSWRGPWTPNWTLLPGRDEWTVYSCPDSWRRQLMQCIYSRRVRCPLFYRSDDILMSDVPMSDFWYSRMLSVFTCKALTCTFGLTYKVVTRTFGFNV